ncbi:MAG: hypothetical protein ABI388_08220 [Bacteroidia bacterium]
MTNTKPSTYEEATQRIAELTIIKNVQEIELKNNLKEVYQNFQLKNIIKNTVKDLTHDKEFRQDGVSAVTGLATDMVIGRLFNKNNSISGFISTLLVEKLALPFIQNNKEKIFSFISNLVSKEKTSNE